MTSPTPLSPAALAVWDAFNQFDHAGMHVDYGIKLAAVLRAAADQVVPVTPKSKFSPHYEEGIWDAKDDVRDQLLAIATELKNAQ